MNPVFADLPVSIFESMSLAAKARGAVNLGQGFPETDGFADVRQAAARALMEHSNQYAPMRGIASLRQAVSDFYGRTQGITLDPEQEVLITSGATEAICAALLALITPGDEVVVFEPMYDAYVPLIERAGGIVRIIPLSPPHWSFSGDDLKAVFNDRTKLVLLTTPNNPTTHCLSRAQLELLAVYCQRYDTYVVADEVWEQVVFGQPHLSVLHLDALRQRSIKIGSAGKIFALTGWKVGFVCADPDLIDQIARAHQFITFSTPPALQYGVAWGLALPQVRFDAALAELATQRDYLTGALEQAGFAVLPSQGTYFINIDLKASGITGSGLDVAQHLVQDCGVATIPLQVFCPTGRDLAVLRLCFAKSLTTLEKGVAGLMRYRG
ncbi:aminotransferase [Asticcacaulis sp. EMRT-3]|uniref:aminotransferase n=1 Tax=Asticcacaulis sp. EMRT-3 TaxID=3040349 RepID=UPI0024AEDAEE|nr:aminotransferase [Asticcacaulis sp. EMRT-3]MDI7776079.1 aminotransferase [Asticcacaulis sp. EMRT-3]